MVTLCSAKPKSRRSSLRAVPKAPPSAGANSAKTPVVVSSGPAAKSPPSPAGRSSGRSRSRASSAVRAASAAVSAARTMSSSASAVTALRVTVPLAAAVPDPAIATTVSSRERIVPLVVSELFAQRRLASLRSVRITTHPSVLESASARSTVSCGVIGWLIGRPPARC